MLNGMLPKIRNIFAAESAAHIPLQCIIPYENEASKQVVATDPAAVSYFTIQITIPLNERKN